VALISLRKQKKQSGLKSHGTKTRKQIKIKAARKERKSKKG